MDLLVNRATGQFMTGVAKPQGDTLEDDDWITFMPTGTTTWLSLIDEEWISYEGFKASEIQQRVGELVARMAADVPPAIIAAPDDEVHVRHVELHRQLADQIRQKEEGELRKLALQLADQGISRSPSDTVATAEKFLKFLKGES